MPRKKYWSKIIEAHGVRVRVYQRPNSSSLWYSVVRNGKKHRKSLKTADRKIAEERAGAIAWSVAELDLTGAPIDRLTIGRLSELYLYHRGPLVTDVRRREVKRILTLFRTHLGDQFVVTDFSQHYVDAFAKARRVGTLRPERMRVGALRPERPRAEAPTAGTIRNHFKVLSTVCNWACTFRTAGRPLIPFNPVKGLKLPREENPARPLATEDRYRKLLNVSDEADPLGRLHCLLVLAQGTGRRVKSLIRLRASDLLFTAETFRAALAEEGQDESRADFWTQAIRWRATNDKKGFLSFSPMTATQRDAVDAYLHDHPVVGEAWLFPRDERHPDEPMTHMVAYLRLVKAERLAGLPHQKQGGWHVFRRAWATKRKHLPVQDVMEAGGWRDVNALQEAYQASDPETVRKVMEVS